MIKPKRFLFEHGLSQKAIAEKANVLGSRFNYFVNGPTIKEKQAIAKACGAKVKVSDLFEGE